MELRMPIKAGMKAKKSPRKRNPAPVIKIQLVPVPAVKRFAEIEASQDWNQLVAPNIKGNVGNW